MGNQIYVTQYTCASGEAYVGALFFINQTFTIRTAELKSRITIKESKRKARRLLVVLNSEHYCVCCL